VTCAAIERDRLELGWRAALGLLLETVATQIVVEVRARKAQL